MSVYVRVKTPVEIYVQRLITIKAGTMFYLDYFQLHKYRLFHVF